MAVRVLFVCLGNICRSPTAHGVFEALVQDQQLTAEVLVDSAGTGDWHIGHAPDKRAAAAALQRGYDLSELRARQVTPDDFHAFDYILAMDEQNLADLQDMAPADHQAVLELFLSFAPHLDEREVPDPYYGGDDGFEQVLNMVEEAASGLLQHIAVRRG